MVTGHRATHRRLRTLIAAAGAVGLALACAAPAQAATTTADGQWWYGAYGVEQVHADGFTGEGVKIAVIDAQINPDLPVFDGADLTVAPDAGCAGTEPTSDQVSSASRHGSTVTALLIGNGTGAGAIRGIVPDASVTFYGTGPLEGCTDSPEAQEAGVSNGVWLVSRALADGADIISMSQGGGDWTSDVIAEAIARQVPLVFSTPNDIMTEGNFPSSYDGVVAVNAVDQDQQLLISETFDLPNIIEETTVVAPGGPFSSIGAPDGTWDDSNLTHGASLATPLVAGILAAAMQKYPDATPNQLIQSLVHNTGADDHEIAYSPDDGFGYGVASLGHVLRVDPTQYEDMNPLLGKNIDQPTDEQIAEATAALATEDPAPAASDGPPGDPGDGGDSGMLTVFVIGGIVVAVVIVAAVILTIILVRRSHRNNREGQS